MAPNLKDIKAIAFDLDGVATDGSIIPVGPTMDDLVRIVNAKDSFATRFAAKQGFGSTIYKHLMNGISHMLPFVVGGGIIC